MQRYHTVGMHAVSLVAEQATVRNLARDEHLASSGTPDQCEYFLLKGILHRHVLDPSGERVTSAFHVEGSTITPHFARTVNGRSMFDLQALEPSQIAAVPVATFDSLRYAHEDLRVFGLKVVEQELIGTIRQAVSFRERSARDRLIDFRVEFPGLENRISHAVIASYLGITPVSFSRLRKELARAH
ncbi:MAG: Crp/Fnr family transcriptional regulator [Flavobacteriales bacterium]|nr:Crp/Fnr family transcriptional regulator [Flavobacteriales bacterium]